MVPEIGGEFKERSQAIVDQYNEYEPLPGLHVNGELTQGENIADIGGVKLAYAALTESARETSRRAHEEDRRLHAGASVSSSRLRQSSDRRFATKIKSFG